MITVPFGTGDLISTVIEQYESLLNEYGPEDILVITGSPTSMDTFRDELEDTTPGAAVPRVTSLVVQATDVVNQTDDRAILSDAIRRELVHRFLEDQEWDSEHFQRAAEQPSFLSDIAQLMETITWQDVSFEKTPELVEVAELVEAFHKWLSEHDHLERGQLITEANAALSETEKRDDVVDVEAILTVEFEEFLPLDRRYLATLANGLELVCVAEENASVRRTWIEPGPITDYVSFSRTESTARTAPPSRPDATGAYLANETVHEDPEAGEVNVIPTETADEQIKKVADEIERLRDRENWEYEDFAVALKQSGSAVIETLRAFQQTGVPTESSTVTGFGDDPAIRELLQVVRYLAADDDDTRIELLEASVLDESILASIEQMEGLSSPLRRWATESNMKVRIAEETSPLNVRAQFGNVRRAFAMAEFVEDTSFIETTWKSFASMLERAHEYAPQQNQTSSTELDGGVRVDHLQAIKNGTFRAVFLLDIVDEEYPGSPSLTRLFSQERLSEMPDYPGVTQVEAEDVTNTFPTSSTASSRSFRRYHAEHARRRLAIGATAAGDRLYFCLYNHKDTALEERAQPSRFLTDAYRQLPWVKEATESEIRSERRAEEYLLSRIDNALADVRRSHSQDVTVSLDEVETELSEIQHLLSESGTRGEQLRDALQARIEFAAGGIRRD
ncbi:DNA helicase UvrD (plasmid) [Natrarchaeobaculum sulfurireducens]|uniref:DNA helicase UvrD n=1 Tax=Natrarchaeobaculum sulfurireducens TaxID=2044521 RepID=A0A346P9D9_9EURY|nr:DNA helicase UvrD [Natrarchaeobaculum sulfurireducens]